MEERFTRRVHTNCMEGLRCPSCKQEDGLRIECIVVCKVTNDGIAPSGDLDFTDGSWCHCPACEHEGTVKDFRLYLGLSPGLRQTVKTLLTVR
jgi:hypothetical protein